MRPDASIDEAAFAAAYEQCAKPVYRFALAMTREPASADDIVQEAFLALLDGSGFDPQRGALLPWLLGVARNLVRRRFREEATHDVFDNEAKPDELEAAGDLLDALELQARVDLLRETIRTLPAPYREAVVLCDLEELTYAETAEALDVAVGVVRSRLHRGRALLARKLAARRETTAKEESA